MVLYLSCIQVFTIMLIGCWLSDAFLRYIKKQVQEFSKGISKSMTENDDFFSIPEITLKELRISGNHLNLEACNNFGHDACSFVMLLRFALWT